MQPTGSLSLAEKLKVPLIVGVTGHRDIKDQDDVREKLRLFWDKIHNLAGIDTPIILLTSIAEGADHLAAVSCHDNDVKYCVVLPFSEEKYREDFEGQALIDFEEDLKGACKVITCDAVPRNYAVASDYVRKHCDVLLTMWDGWETLDDSGRKPAKGGTYYQIRSAFGMDDLLQHHEEKRHLIVNIEVERDRKGPGSHVERGEVRKCVFSQKSGLSVISPGIEEEWSFSSDDFLEWADEWRWELRKKFEEPFSSNGMKDFSDVLKFVRLHNCSVRTEVPSQPHRSYLRDSDHFGSSEDGRRALSIVEDDFDRYEYFDDMAESHQKLHKKQFLWIAVGTVLLAILGLVLPKLMFHLNEWIRACGWDSRHEWIKYGLCLLYAAGCFKLFSYSKRITKEDHYSLYLQPRAIAEMFRLKVFWKLAGIPESFADHILEENTARWFVLLLCNWEIAEPPPSDMDRKWIEAGNGIKFVKICWLEDQRKYYDKYLLPDRRYFILPQEKEKCREKMFLSPAWFREYFSKYERMEGYISLGKRCFPWGGFLLAISLLIVLFYYSFVKNGGLIVEICTPLLFASLGWLLKKNKSDPLSSQYRSLAYSYREVFELFGKAIAYIERYPEDIGTQRSIIKELMMLAHKENTEWHSIKSDAKPKNAA